MNRQLLLGIGTLSITQQTVTPVQLTRSLSSRTDTRNRNDSGNVSPIREWLASFNDNVEMVLSSNVKIEHNPSTQNMSRSFTKLKCRAPIDALRGHVPQKVLERVQECIHYKRGPDAVVTTLERSKYVDLKRQGCVKIGDILREKAKDIIAEASRKPPKQLPKPPLTNLPKAEEGSLVDVKKGNKLAALATDWPDAMPSESTNRTAVLSLLY